MKPGAETPTSEGPVQRWLAKNKRKIESHDGLPGPWHREHIFNSIRPRSKVGIITPHGNILTGSAVMVFPSHAVLNGGGAHGTPLIADRTNTIYCKDFKF